MKRSFSLLLAGGLVASLAACDYNNTPGKDPQASQDFTRAPKARATETNLDSISGQQNVNPPAGTGSPADQQTSADAGLNAAPNNANSPVGSIPEQSTEARASAREN